MYVKLTVIGMYYAQYFKKKHCFNFIVIQTCLEMTKIIENNSGKKKV